MIAGGVMAETMTHVGGRAFYGKVAPEEAKRRARVSIRKEIGRLQALLDDQENWKVTYWRGNKKLDPPRNVKCNGEGFCPAAVHNPDCKTMYKPEELFYA